MSLLRNILNGIRRAFRLSNTKFIGEDHMGNRYFEKTIDTRKGLEHKRYAEGPTKDSVEANIPPEWDAWLRRTRLNPPTPEELQRNYMMKMNTKQKVMELEEQCKQEHENTDNQNIASNLSSSMLRDKKQFPVHEEYEDVPKTIPKRHSDN